MYNIDQLFIDKANRKKLFAFLVMAKIGIPVPRKSHTTVVKYFWNSLYYLDCIGKEIFTTITLIFFKKIFQIYAFVA